jgi:Protein of unknown function (DUF4230)
MAAILRYAIRFVLLIIFLFGIISLWESFRTGHWLPSWFSDTPQTTQTIVLKEVQTLGKLELVQYNFKDVVEHELLREWMPNPKAVLIVQGEAVGCIDLTKITTSDISTESDTLVVHLPEPELCSFKIDHQNSKIYNTEYAFIEEAQLVQDAYQQAEKQIRTSALQMGIIDQTRRNADLILKPMLEKISGKKILLRYRLKGNLSKPK